MSTPRPIKISEYGIRYGAFFTCVAGDGLSHSLWHPKKASMKYSFYKMLWLLHMNPMKTRKEIFDFININPFNRYILQFGNLAFNPTVHDYWAQLFRENYLQQFRDGKRILYKITSKGLNELQNLPENEKRILGL